MFLNKELLVSRHIRSLLVCHKKSKVFDLTSFELSNIISFGWIYKM